MNRLHYYVFFLFIGILFCSCSENAAISNESVTGNDVDLSAFQSRIIPNSEWKHVSRNHSNGDVFEEGFIFNGKKVGTWTSYYPDNGYLQNVSNFNNGVLMGPFFEFDERGRLNKHYTYENNVLSGHYAEFKNGRIVKRIQYLNGKINGYVRDYNNKSQIVKEANYKDNVLHGEVNNYNDEGKLVLQYFYKNGEKISGGIVE